MAVQRTPMTRPGYDRLRDELDRLKRVDRHAITKAIAEARAHGDLSENAEYHAAREKQSFIEGRIAELETKVGSAEVIDPPTSGDRITFASTVLLEDASGKEIRYQIVGSDGKSVGDRVTAQLPGGTKTFDIVKANFPWAD